ncbi:SDR family oxidoreductase [Gilvimarinus sp. SDUM040013]|uniref:SDR family oxidoreductase n=1 Tax=Gilvimarinus gilvus TaxID=3058038 RepID=A0ABU4RZ88_9GAMM|nr:SDR family oxidoreductase [Gilvimarinus sp. SDUM040013]MDO3384550.1 SDR family oxidoreductase [Gilvimarinus sp. SDUM040013]MDX6850115.1 SDR family oxidoreductase [Gilvimarinus sp. SDUM040013]
MSKTVLITGGTSGIGYASAKALKAEGNRVLITGRDQARLDKAASELGVEAILCDSTNAAAIVALGKRLAKDGITLDGLVLNAGIFYPRAISDESWDNIQVTMNTNFAGPFMMMQALAGTMSNPASVVFISSVAVEKAHPTCAAYAASKAAFEAAAGVMNVELAASGIRVNSIRPGVTLTEIQKKAGMSDEDIAGLAESLKGLPVGRILSPADIVPAVQYLLSDASIAMRNGHMTIDGGFGL